MSTLNQKYSDTDGVGLGRCEECGYMFVNENERHTKTGLPGFSCELHKAVHIDDWIELPPANDQEKLVKEWFDHFRRPAIQKDYKWLAARKVFCIFEGKRMRCTGASRMGDVWLTYNLVKDFGYDRRVDVAGCSDWTVEGPK